MREPDLERRARELLELFTLSEKADALVRTYSGGQKRRLDVAMGLVHRPQVLFLDEPTTGLDPEARAAMWDELSRLASAEQLTILLTTHYLEEADRLAERVAIVSQGKVVVDGAPEALKRALRGDAVTIELANGDGCARRRARARRCPTCTRCSSTATASTHASSRGRRRCPACSPRSTPPECGVQAVTVSRPSLDDVYLHYTGRDFHSDDRGRHMTAVAQTLFLFVRLMRNLARQPIWIALMLIQPMFWLAALQPALPPHHRPARLRHDVVRRLPRRRASRS